MGKYSKDIDKVSVSDVSDGEQQFCELSDSVLISGNKVKNALYTRKTLQQEQQREMEDERRLWGNSMEQNMNNNKKKYNNQINRSVNQTDENDYANHQSNNFQSTKDNLLTYSLYKLLEPQLTSIDYSLHQPLIEMLKKEDELQNLLQQIEDSLLDGGGIMEDLLQGQKVMERLKQLKQQRVLNSESKRRQLEQKQSLNQSIEQQQSSLQSSQGLELNSIDKNENTDKDLKKSNKLMELQLRPSIGNCFFNNDNQQTVKQPLNNECDESKLEWKINKLEDQLKMMKTLRKIDRQGERLLNGYYQNYINNSNDNHDTNNQENHPQFKEFIQRLPQMMVKDVFCYDKLVNIVRKVNSQISE